MKHSATIIASVALALFGQQCTATTVSSVVSSVVHGIDDLKARDIADEIIAKRQETGTTSTSSTSDAWTLISECVADVLAGSNSAYTEINYPENVFLYNAPATCLAAIESYNASPNAKRLDAAYGTINSDGSKVNMSGIPSWGWKAVVDTVGSAASSGSNSPQDSGIGSVGAASASGSAGPSGSVALGAQSVTRVAAQSGAASGAASESAGASGLPGANRLRRFV